jgi:peptidoglycan/xylan/chitin deacetylase (PgdA/CDA1 family)
MTAEPAIGAHRVASSGATRAAWHVRSWLNPERRRAVRRATDPWIGPLGSICGAEAPHAFALTFDDGPGPATRSILDVLARHDATATFFVLVDRAEARPDLVRRIVAAGHEVGLHGLDHQRLTTLAPGAVRAHVAQGKHRLERCTGQSVRYFRPPYGSQSPRTFAAARRCGLEVVVWTSDADDWIDHDASHVAQLALERVRPGGVALLHDGFASDPGAALPEPQFDRAQALDDFLAGSDLHARSVSDLLAAGRARRTAWFRP